MSRILQEAERSVLARPDAPDDELRLLKALSGGDEAAVMALVDRYQSSMVRLAMLYVHDRATAEDVVQETWLGVLRGLGRFEPRASLKAWIFRILINRAKTRAGRDGRSVSFSAVRDPHPEPAVEAARFRASEPWRDHWASPPRSWSELPEDRLLSRETLQQVRAAAEALPPNQREVFTLRDIEGCTADEVCRILDISDTNQRVLLHRARSKVRRALEHYFDGT